MTRRIPPWRASPATGDAAPDAGPPLASGALPPREWPWPEPAFASLDAALTEVETEVDRITAIYEDLREDLFRVHAQGTGHHANVRTYRDPDCQTCNLLVRAYGFAATFPTLPGVADTERPGTGPAAPGTAGGLPTRSDTG